jgi:hypothetical protein
MIRPYIRASYAIGYAEYCSEVSAQAEEECAFLMDVGPDMGPGVLEAARELAKFRGLKDELTNRRKALTKKWLERLTPVFKQFLPLAPKIVKAVQPTEADAGDILSILKAGLSDAEWQQVLQDAWVEATAEGNVGAQAFLAAARNEPNISFDHSFPQAVDALRDLKLNDANEWIDKQLNGMAASLGSDLADALAQGLSYDDMLSIVRDGISDGGDAALMLDTMMSTGVTDGSLDLYGEEGVTMVDILTSADDDECSDAADDNPWDIDEADGMIPFHPNCRCCVAPHIE